ncbi:MAG: YdbH domain-containing protein [Gammaproteobacteria bacterium]|nr:YdbH domain-containing protein [Gammaproteobacteria bacterium]
MPSDSVYVFNAISSSGDKAHFSITSQIEQSALGGNRTPTWGVTRGRVTLQPAPFSVVFERYLAGFIADLPIGALTSAGTIAANAKWRDGPELVELSLTDLEVDDGERFAMWDVNGDVRWARQDAGPSAVEWGGVSVAGVALGAGRASGRLHGGNVELDAPIVMEVLGGEVALSTLRAADLGTDEMLVESNLRVSGVSMEEVSASMGWPPFAGELEGRLDNIRVRQDAVSVDGGVSVNLFDGTVRIDNLRLADPFGALPRLSADVLVNNVSLGLLTNAFEFGGIEGGLDGVVTDLQLVGWKVAGFDARLFSSPNDKRKHRISQRAVDNLASIGGGPQAVLSQTFLRFFEEFSYDKLGLSCRLVNEVCEMGGVEAADSGYYIVKGAGIPRIDIRGYRNRVSWPSLVERLIAAARSKGPVVQ